MIAFSSKKLSSLAAFSLGLLISCGPKEADRVGEAQLCLDKAPQGSAAACMEKIAGIESKGAYTLRCSAGFIDEGFTKPARFKSAFDALSNNGTNNTEAFLGILAFSSKATAILNKNFASETYANCTKSEAKGMMLLGSMAITATTLTSLGAGIFVGGVQPSPTDIATAINSAIADPTAKSEIGAAVATTYKASCQSGAKADAALCTQLDAALVNVNIEDPAAIGDAILNYWKNH